MFNQEKISELEERIEFLEEILEIKNKEELGLNIFGLPVYGKASMFMKKFIALLDYLKVEYKESPKRYLFIKKSQE